MTKKKNTKANLENKKPTLLLIGLIVSLAIVLESFEWMSVAPGDSSYVASNVDDTQPDVFEEKTIEEEKPTPPKQKPKPKPKPIVVDSVIVSVDTTHTEPVFTFDSTLANIDIDPDPCPDCPTGDDGGDGWNVEIEEIFDVVEEMPEFPGGMEKLYPYLSSKVKYPRISVDNNSQGKALINFTVEKDGSLTDVKVIKSSADKFCNKEAIRVVEGMPKWTPGKQRGKLVRVSYTIPVKFKLR